MENKIYTDLLFGKHLEETVTNVLNEQITEHRVKSPPPYLRNGAKIAPRLLLMTNRNSLTPIEYS